MPGRINANTASRALVAADVAIGVGWGGTATFAIGAGSNDQRGSVTVTASATTPAQATATIAITFAQAYEAPPFAVVCRGGGTGVVTIGFNIVTVTATVLTAISDTVPVAGSIYECIYEVLG
jgi:hypothetical protein